MKKIPNRVVRLFMSAFVTAAREDHSNLIILGDQRFDDLRSRADFAAVIDYLKSSGLVVVQLEGDRPSRLTLTDDGATYCERQRDAANERRWTRGLAVVALVISLFALLLELDDRGYLGDFLSGFKSTGNVTQSSEG